MNSLNIPDNFIHWAYHERAQLIRRQAEGEEIQPQEIFLGFSRHTPAIVSSGPAGLNASIKGVGFIPKEEYLRDTVDAYLQHIQVGWRDGYSEVGLQLLMRLLYGEGCQERIDFTRFGTLELARQHTWENLQSDPKVTLLFYQPPTVSFEVRGRAEIYEEGSIYHTLLNAQHDVYHRPNPDGWKDRPAYLFVIEEIFDNSVTPKGFGKKIFG
jgi:hypothetical protein